MTEKMGGAEGTQMDVDFMDMERVNITAIMYCPQLTALVFRVDQNRL
jgi:hypothetical protein